MHCAQSMRRGLVRCGPPAPPASLPLRPVFVVTTRGGRHLFGVHRADRRELYTSYVLGFDRNEHAMALAKGLEAYRRANGCFPPRDLTVADMELLSQDPGSVQTMSHVAVDEMPLAELLWRLRGTGIVLSLLTAVDGGDEFTFTWRDIKADSAWPQAAVNRLDALLRQSEAMWDTARAVPGLLPKPRRPVAVNRVLEALCKLARQVGGALPPGPPGPMP